MGVGKVDREGRQENKNPTPPHSLVPTLKSCTDLGNREGLCWWGERDIKATDFLTSLRAWGCPPSTSASGSRGWDGEGQGGLQEGALPSPHKVQAPPATVLAQREA